MIKLKDVIYYDGSNVLVRKKQLNEQTGNLRTPVELGEAKIDSRSWRKLKSDIAKQIEQLVKVGEDYEVFQSAKYTAKTLKQIQKLWSKLG